MADLLGSAPENLNTLEELARALNEDENFSATVIGQIARKVDIEEGKGLSANDFTDDLKFVNNKFFDEIFDEDILLVYDFDPNTYYGQLAHLSTGLNRVYDMYGNFIGIRKGWFSLESDETGYYWFDEIFENLDGEVYVNSSEDGAQGPWWPRNEYRFKLTDYLFSNNNSSGDLSDYVKKEELGDIENALDAILRMENELIGGVTYNE